MSAQNNLVCDFSLSVLELFPNIVFFSQEKVLRLSADVQAADSVEPSQGALRKDGGGQRGQGWQHSKEFHS